MNKGVPRQYAGRDVLNTVVQRLAGAEHGVVSGMFRAERCDAKAIVLARGNC